MKINVGVIYGGESVEHEVSIISAIQAMKALDEHKYEVIPLYISKQRRLYSSNLLKDISNYTDMDGLLAKADEVYLLNQGNKVLLKAVKPKLFSAPYLQTIDVVIPVIHGTNGEDGTVQGYLEMLKVPYSGCDVVAAGVGQDKVIMKYVLAGSKVPICDWLWFYGHEFEKDQDQLIPKIDKLGYPVIIKPACLGSSVGIQIVHQASELSDAVNEAGKYDRKLVVEKMIKHLIEINCSVMGDCYSCAVSSLEQVMKQEEILSYQDKYGGNKKSKGSSKGMAGTSRIVPAPISAERTEYIQELAIKTFKVLGASGVCRIDFLVDRDTDEVYVNEINTIPGSLAFYLWQASGVDFTQLMDQLVKQAVDRQRQREKMIYSYDTNILAGYRAGFKGKAKG